MGKAVKWYQHIIFQEVALFGGMFFLTIIHEWAKLELNLDNDAVLPVGNTFRRELLEKLK